MTFQLFDFSALQTVTLYDILRLRNEVFICEQQCIYPDLDGKDVMATHVLGFVDDKLVGYARILPPGISYPHYASIGRVLIDPPFRKKGYAKQLMMYTLQTCEQLYAQPIKISAQQYIKQFYASLGFIEQGEIYLEDGIPHICMIRTKNE